MSEKIEFKAWANNCARLAEFLATVPDELHDQRNFVDFTDGYGYDALCKHDVEHACGTSACAMGWAAVSKQFDGLRYDYEINGPSINGHYIGWDEAADKYFGPYSMHGVFLSMGDKADTIDRLTKLATTYCDMAKSFKEEPTS